MPTHPGLGLPAFRAVRESIPTVLSNQACSTVIAAIQRLIQTVKCVLPPCSSVLLGGRNDVFQAC